MSQTQLLHHAVAERLRTVATLIGSPASAPLEIDGQAVIPGLGLSNAEAQLRHRADRLQQGHLLITAIGAVSRGKSTLLNACLGGEVFPSGPEAVTGGICKVVYGDNPEAVTLVEEGGTRTMPSANFCEWISLSTDEQPPIDSDDPFPVPERLENLHHAVLHSDAALCKKGIRFIDTLGFNAGLKQELITERFLRETDALLVVLETKPLFNEDDVALVKKHYYGDDESGIGNMFFAINDFGIFGDEQLRVLMEETAPRKLQNYFLNAAGEFDQELFDRRVFLVQAKRALEAKVAGAGDDVLEQTGILALESALERVMSEGENTRIAVDAAMARYLLPVLEEARSSIQRQAANLRVGSKAFTIAVREAGDRLEVLAQKAQDIRETIRSFGQRIGSKAAAHFETSFIHRFVTPPGRRAKPPWYEDWDKLEIGSLLSLRNVSHAAISKRKRDELADEMRTRLGGYIHSCTEAWGKEVLEHLQTDINEMIAATEQEVTEFGIQLDEIQQYVARQQLGDEFVDMDKRRALKASQMLFGALLLDPNQVMGPMLDAGWKPFIIRLVADIVAVLLASILASFFAGPVGWAVFFGALFAELVLIHQRDRAFMMNRVRHKIGEELRKAFVAQGPEFKAEIQKNLEQQFTQLAANLQGSLDGEIAAVQRELETARETRRGGQAAIDEEKVRLETIKTLLTAQFEELSRAIYGRVLTSEEQNALVERFTFLKDEDDA